MTIQTVNKGNLEYDFNDETGELSNFQPLTLSDQSAAILTGGAGNVKTPGGETIQTSNPATIPNEA